MKKLLSLPPNLVECFHDIEKADRTEWFCTSDPIGLSLIHIFCEKIKNPDCRNQDFTVFFSSRWCHQESNRGHKDFQSFALPTELWHHYFLFAVAKVVKLF